MGEIADALRRARESRSRKPEGDAPGRTDVLAALQRAEEERGDAAPTPSPDTSAGHGEAGESAPAQEPTGVRNALQRAALSRAAAQGPRPPQPLPSAPTSPAQTVQELEPASPAVAFHGKPTVEICRGVAVRVREQAESRGVHTVAIVSGLRGEGKSTVLCDLGLALTTLTHDRAIALVDLDLRRPSLAGILGIHARAGVEDVLAGRLGLDQIRIAVQRPAFDLYPTASPQSSPQGLLVTRHFEGMIRDLEATYDLVLIDTPPALVVPDVSVMLRHVGACILIARRGITRTRSFVSLVEALPRRKILGEVLNEGQLARYAYQYAATDSEPAPESGRRGLLGRKQPT